MTATPDVPGTSIASATSSPRQASADVLVLGGGIGGLPVAKELLGRKFSVIVADRHDGTRFASLRNFGWLQSGALEARRRSKEGDAFASTCAEGFRAIEKAFPDAIGKTRGAFLFALVVHAQLASAVVFLGSNRGRPMLIPHPGLGRTIVSAIGSFKEVRDDSAFGTPTRGEREGLVRSLEEWLIDDVPKGLTEIGFYYCYRLMALPGPVVQDLNDGVFALYPHYLTATPPCASKSADAVAQYLKTPSLGLAVEHSVDPTALLIPDHACKDVGGFFMRRTGRRLRMARK